MNERVRLDFPVRGATIAAVGDQAREIVATFLGGADADCEYLIEAQPFCATVDGFNRGWTAEVTVTITPTGTPGV